MGLVGFSLAQLMLQHSSKQKWWRQVDWHRRWAYSDSRNHGQFVDARPDAAKLVTTFHYLSCPNQTHSWDERDMQADRHSQP
jgi:hypothetical protein